MGTGGVGAVGSGTAVRKHAALKKFIKGLQHLEAQRSITVLKEEIPALLQFLASSTDDLIERGRLRDSTRILP